MADATAAGNPRSCKKRKLESLKSTHELRTNDRGSEFWNHVKTMSLEGDKLVVTTQAE